MRLSAGRSAQARRQATRLQARSEGGWDALGHASRPAPRVASLMAERGYSPAQIAAHLGHADGGVLALRTYIHADALETPDFLDETLRGQAKG